MESECVDDLPFSEQETTQIDFEAVQFTQDI